MIISCRSLMSLKGLPDYSSVFKLVSVKIKEDKGTFMEKQKCPFSLVLLVKLPDWFPLLYSFYYILMCVLLKRLSQINQEIENV